MISYLEPMSIGTFNIVMAVLVIRVHVSSMPCSKLSLVEAVASPGHRVVFTL